MDDFVGAYGDKRRSAAMSRLYGAMVEQGSVVVRKLGGDRGGELAAHRVLSSARVTPTMTLRCLSRGTAAACVGRIHPAGTAGAMIRSLLVAVQPSSSKAGGHPAKRPGDH